jgi:CHAD domain-containing protein
MASSVSPACSSSGWIALRRLRSAFSLFRPLLIGDEPKRIQEELRWLAGVLGEARNLDVLLMKTKDSDLRPKLKDARNKAYGAAVEALESARARSCSISTSGFNVTSIALAVAQLPTSLRLRSLPREPSTRCVRSLKHGSALAETDDEHRHQVRKDAKKLRYAVEFFGSLFDDKRGARRHRKFIAAMEELQDYH